LDFHDDFDDDDFDDDDDDDDDDDVYNDNDNMLSNSCIKNILQIF
jgi:hypothetical protein